MKTLLALGLLALLATPAAAQDPRIQAVANCHGEQKCVAAVTASLKAAVFINKCARGARGDVAEERWCADFAEKQVSPATYRLCKQAWLRRNIAQGKQCIAQLDAAGVFAQAR